MADDLIAIPITILVVLVALALFFIGYSCGEGEIEKSAVTNNVGEWYVDSTGSKAFHFYIEPKK